MIPRFPLLKCGVTSLSRALSYPQVPLTSPLPDLKVPVRTDSGSQSWKVEDSNFPPTTVTSLENGLQVASQEAFGQSSIVGGM